MKIKNLLLVAALLAARLSAETLTVDTAVFAQTDAKSPVLARLKSGTAITPVGEAPAGWRRIEISGPFEAYVHNRDITKGLEVREGASIYAAPNADAALITTAIAGDKTEITGLRGDYCQIKLEKKIQGFIATHETANIASDTTVPRRSPAPKAAVSGPIPKPGTSSVGPTPAFTPGRQVQSSGNNAAMPRSFAGRLVSARRILLNPNPPYDYQLTDASGRRFAYVETKRLLLTDKIEAYLERDVAITGTVRNTVDGKDLVIAAESMQLQQP